MVAYTPDIEYVLPSMLLLLTDLIWSNLKNYEAISWAIPASVETPRASDQTVLKRSLWMPPLLQISYISQTLSGLTSWPFYKHSWDFSVFKTSLYHPICMYFSHTQKKKTPQAESDLSKDICPQNTMSMTASGLWAGAPLTAFLWERAGHH